MIGRRDFLRLEEALARQSSKGRLGTFQTSITIIAAIVTGFLAVTQWRESNQLRVREARIEQVKQGKQLLEALFDDQATTAIRAVLDHRKFTTRIGKSDITITENDLLKILTGAGGNEEQRRIAFQSLDALFFHFAMIDHWIETGLVQESDVLAPLSFYARKMSTHPDAFVAYANEIGLEGVVRFLERYGSASGPRSLSNTQTEPSHR